MLSRGPLYHCELADGAVVGASQGLGDIADGDIDILRRGQLFRLIQVISELGSSGGSNLSSPASGAL